MKTKRILPISRLRNCKGLKEVQLERWKLRKSTLKYVARLKVSKDVEIGDTYICKVRGYTVEKTPSDRCSLCNVSKEQFHKF